MRKIALLFILCNSFWSAKVYCQAFANNTTSIYAGYGAGTFASYFYTTDFFNGGDNTQKKQAGPFYVKYEKSISNCLSLGVNVAFLYNQWTTQNEYYNYPTAGPVYTYTYQRTTFSALVRFNYHFIQNNVFDVYYGFGMGYREATNKYSTNDPSGNSANPFYDSSSGLSSFPLGFETTFGAKWLATNNFGLYAEIGMAKSVVQGGVFYNIQGKNQ